jgi:hypothetical protein
VNVTRTGEEVGEPQIETFVTVRQPGVVTFFASAGQLADAIAGEGATVGHPLAVPVNGYSHHPGCPDCNPEGAA